jgi:hypothetical protein
MLTERAATKLFYSVTGTAGAAWLPLVAMKLLANSTAMYRGRGSGFHLCSDCHLLPSSASHLWRACFGAVARYGSAPLVPLAV